MVQWVLFLCTHNSARSQMAEGLLRFQSDGTVEARSAGTQATHVRVEAIEVMREVGIDISRQASKTLDRYVNDRFDAVVTVCDSANESCPIFPNAKRRLHWSIPDPSQATGCEAERLEAFRAARDRLRERIETELLPNLAETAV